MNIKHRISHTLERMPLITYSYKYVKRECLHIYAVIVSFISGLS